MQIKSISKKAIALLVLLVTSLAILHMFSVWQLDLICVGPVWSSGWCHPEGRYADDYFQCWLWRTTIGEAYDTLLFLNFVSFYGLIMVFSIMLYGVIQTLKKGKRKR